MKQTNKATQVASESKRTELITTFAMPQFVEIVENLQMAVYGVDRLMSRYDETDKRRLMLADISDTISQCLYSKLSGVVGSDFIECSVNTIAKHSQRNE